MQTSDGQNHPQHEPGIEDPFAAIYFRQINEEREKESQAGRNLYYAVVEKIDQGIRPLNALLEMHVADELTANEDVVRFCNQLITDEHGDPFEHLRLIYPPESWREFLMEARRKNLKFPDPMSELDFIAERFREYDANKAKQTSLPSPNPPAST